MRLLEHTQQEIEKRGIKRFKVAVLAIVQENNGAGAANRIETVSRDISANGAFFLTPAALPVGTDLKVKLFLLPNDPPQSAVTSTEVDLKGSVVRIEHDGIAVHFEKKYEIFQRNQQQT